MQNGKIICDRQTLQKQFQPWGAINAAGVPIHFGEMGCYKHTPPEVVLAWFNDTLDVIGELKSGWALVEFPRTVWSGGHRTSRNQIRGLARPPT